MKKTIIAAIAVALTFASCAKEKTFTRSNGTQFAAKPYDLIMNVMLQSHTTIQP